MIPFMLLLVLIVNAEMLPRKFNPGKSNYIEKHRWSQKHPFLHQPSRTVFRHFHARQKVKKCNKLRMQYRMNSSIHSPFRQFRNWHTCNHKHRKIRKNRRFTPNVDLQSSRRFSKRIRSRLVPPPIINYEAKNPGQVLKSHTDTRNRLKSKVEPRDSEFDTNIFEDYDATEISSSTTQSSRENFKPSAYMFGGENEKVGNAAVPQFLPPNVTSLQKGDLQESKYNLPDLPSFTAQTPAVFPNQMSSPVPNPAYNSNFSDRFTPEQTLTLFNSSELTSSPPVEQQYPLGQIPPYYKVLPSVRPETLYSGSQSSVLSANASATNTSNDGFQQAVPNYKPWNATTISSMQYIRHKMKEIHRRFGRREKILTAVLLVLILSTIIIVTVIKFFKQHKRKYPLKEKNKYTLIRASKKEQKDLLRRIFELKRGDIVGKEELESRS